MKKLLSLFILALLPLLASADPVEIDGIYYNLEVIEKADLYIASVVKSSSYPYSGDIVIPESIEYNNVKYIVTSIGNSAFSNCKGLTSITIPNCLTKIGNFAFQDCRGLTSVHISDIEAWCKIVFSDDYSNPLLWAGHLFVNGEEVKNLIIPNSITSIADYAFYCCNSLQSVIIPNSVRSIGKEAFLLCENLISVTIGDGVTIIESCAFQDSYNLTTVTIGSSVTCIGHSAFFGCSSLTSITIPNSVTSIEKYAFGACSSLTSITIPNSVTSIGEYAFGSCSSLTSITIPNSVTSIGEKVFSKCSSLNIISIGNGVNKIGPQAFEKCPELTDVYCYAEKVPSMKDDYGNSCTDAFDGSYIEYATLHIPTASIDTYKSTEPWSNFGTILALDGSAFHGLTINVGKNGIVAYGTNNITNNSRTFNIKEGSDVTLTFTPSDGYRLSSVTINNVDKTADVSEGTLTISNVSADVTVSVSFILDGESAAVTITDAGVATFCSDKDLDFSEVFGLKAYTGAGFNKSTGQLILLEVTDVPAGTGLLLKGAAGNYEIPEKTSSSVFANLLVGVTAETALSQTDGGYTNYILGNGTNGPGFFKVSDAGGNLAAGKAYLRIPTSAAGARTTISLDFSGDASGICDIEYDAPGREAWFNVQGRRLESAPTKAGLYIRNGKKYIVK